MYMGLDVTVNVKKYCLVLQTYLALREPEVKTPDIQGVSVKEVVDVKTHQYQSKLKV